MSASDESNDPVLQGLLKMQAALERDAMRAGDGPNNRRKSDFKTEADRALFIDAWGLDAYLGLPD